MLFRSHHPTAPVSKKPLAYLDVVLRSSDVDFYNEVTGKVLLMNFPCRSCLYKQYCTVEQCTTTPVSVKLSCSLAGLWEFSTMSFN